MIELLADIPKPIIIVLFSGLVVLASFLVTQIIDLMRAKSLKSDNALVDLSVLTLSIKESVIKLNEQVVGLAALFQDMKNQISLLSDLKIKIMEADKDISYAHDKIRELQKDINWHPPQNQT